jgi:hypothetical protein
MAKVPEYEVLDAEVLERYQKLEDGIRERALDLIDSEELSEVTDSAHLLATVLIGVAYQILDESGYSVRAVVDRYLTTVERAEAGDLVFVEQGKLTQA